LDGEHFELESELDCHPNGRCVAVPEILGMDVPQWELGSNWLSNQSEAQQREIMGNARFELWKGGMPLDAFAGKSHSDEWGDTPIIVPLKDLQ
jgi:hypothetical protein